VSGGLHNPVLKHYFIGMPQRTLSLLDVFGPVMIGPSSSHTAGVARITYLARALFPHRLQKARVSFYGSLAATWRGHGSDKAAIAGLLGMLPDDERISDAPRLAEREGLPVEIVSVTETPAHYHPNTCVVEQWGGGSSLRVRGASVGGGEVRLESIAGFPAGVDGSLDAVLVFHHDEPGVIAGVAAVLARLGLNIAALSSHRKDKGEEALLVAEVDGAVPPEALAALREVRGIREAVTMPSLTRMAEAGR
jgi:L-serine dehydratase